jgi:hypothetical protein
MPMAPPAHTCSKPFPSKLPRWPLAAAPPSAGQLTPHCPLAGWPQGPGAPPTAAAAPGQLRAQCPKPLHRRQTSPASATLCCPGRPRPRPAGRMAGPKGPPGNPPPPGPYPPPNPGAPANIMCMGGGMGGGAGGGTCCAACIARTAAATTRASRASSPPSAGAASPPCPPRRRPRRYHWPPVPPQSASAHVSFPPSVPPASMDCISSSDFWGCSVHSLKHSGISLTRCGTCPSLKPGAEAEARPRLGVHLPES